MNKLPVWKKPPTEPTIEELRELAAAHGLDVTVLVSWTHEAGGYHFVTVGADRNYADAAVRLREKLTAALGVKELGPVRDLRADHPQPEPWTQEQKQALASVFDTMLRVLPEVPLNRQLQALYLMYVDKA